MNAEGRVVVATFGSAGDLLPLIPVIGALRDGGRSVTAVVPRSLGLYLRALGLPALGIGDGSEMRVVDDPAIFTTRFDGWSSWRRTLTHYIAPTLEADVARIVADWEADPPALVITSGFAVAARVAAHRTGVPAVEVSIYPQHQEMRSTSFARPVIGQVAALAGVGADEAAALVWGRADVLLHDAELLGSTRTGTATVVGFPYWDGVPASPADVAAVSSWLAEGDGPTVLATLGSFVGLAARHTWVGLADALGRSGVRALVLGPRGRWAEEHLPASPALRTAGFVPLSTLAGSVDLVVHHGGLGTTFGAVHLGVPAIVLPQAFDQPFNALLAERAGVGVVGDPASLADQITSLVRSAERRDHVEQVRRRLVPSDDAVRAACARITDRDAVVAR